MRTKTAIIASVASFIGVLAVGIVIIIATVDTSVSGSTKTAEAIGKLLGFLTCIPVAIIWIKWAMDRRSQTPPPQPPKKNSPPRRRRPPE